MEGQAIPQVEYGRKDDGSTTHRQQKQTPVESLTRQELETRIRQLEAHNKQLQNLLAKSQGITGISTKGVSDTKTKKAKSFDFTRHSKRHVLLKFAYLGWDYQGFAVQEDTQQTIEAQLFSAFLKTRLIESRETSNYHRCGRTDKGVSAFDQVISITLRSKMKSGVGVISPRNTVMSSGEDDRPEINYVQLLNKVLPLEIRMLAWCPVSSGYSARFDCSFRTYKYFFPRGRMNIKLMNEGAQYLVGYHDYRNFCKMDVGNGVVNFCRRILSVDIAPVCCDVQREGEQSLNKRVENQFEEVQSKEHEKDRNIECDFDRSNSCKPYIYKPTSVRQTFGSSCPQHKSGIKFSCQKSHSTDGYDMCVATIEGQAFLWHQVRAVMAILFLIGEGNEKPEIVAELLDVEKNPRKPQYCLASDVPLNLYETSFEGVEWQWDDQNLHFVISQLQGLWTKYSVRTTMIRKMLWDLETRYIKVIKSKGECAANAEILSSTQEESGIKFPQEQSTCLIPGARTKVYRPLLSRPTCESLETRVEHYIKRQRIDPVILEKISSVKSDGQQKQLS